MHCTINTNRERGSRDAYHNPLHHFDVKTKPTHSMTTLNFPSVLVPLVGLVFPAIAMASLFLHVQKNKIV
ncbi:putative photosystem I [Helianthus debilis subsp. tardiflorus]